jgi:hypothetical protein
MGKGDFLKPFGGSSPRAEKDRIRKFYRDVLGGTIVRE